MKLKNKKDVKSFNASKKLKNKAYVQKILFECFKEGDIDGFKEILRTHFELVNKDKMIRKAKIPKTTFYRTLSKGSNPTLKSMAKLLKAI